MSGFQRLMKTILPAKTFAAMEAESKRWLVRCSCGFERTIWEMGGIRYKAHGDPKKYLRCPKCERFTSHLLVLEPEVAPQK